MATAVTGNTRHRDGKTEEDIPRVRASDGALRVAAEQSISNAFDAFFKTIQRESDNVGVEGFNALLDGYTERIEGLRCGKKRKRQSTVVESSEKILGLLDDVKQKLTDKEYKELADECQTIHNGEASITVGRGPDGRERTLSKSSFERIIEFNAKLSLARELHPKISKLFLTVEDLKRNPEVDMSIVNQSTRELNELRARHNRLMSEADDYFNRAIRDPIFDLVYYGSLNFTYLFKMYELRMNRRNQRT